MIGVGDCKKGVNLKEAKMSPAAPSCWVILSLYLGGSLQSLVDFLDGEGREEEEQETGGLSFNFLILFLLAFVGEGRGTLSLTHKPSHCDVKTGQPLGKI